MSSSMATSRMAVASLLNDSPDAERPRSEAVSSPKLPWALTQEDMRVETKERLFDVDRGYKDELRKRKHQDDSKAGQKRKRAPSNPWSEEEHEKFLVGLRMFGKGDWRRISRFLIPSRTPVQIGSHAQKFFLRLRAGQAQSSLEQELLDADLKTHHNFSNSASSMSSSMSSSSPPEYQDSSSVETTSVASFDARLDASAHRHGLVGGGASSSANHHGNWPALFPQGPPIPQESHWQGASGYTLHQTPTSRRYSFHVPPAMELVSGVPTGVPMSVPMSIPSNGNIRSGNNLSRKKQDGDHPHPHAVMTYA